MEERPFKMRVWDPEYQEMHILKGNVREVFLRLGSILESVGNAVPSRCTEYKDKDENYIYEGDIVKIHGWDGERTVRYFPILAGWGLETESKSWADQLETYDMEELKIVGNIYQRRKERGE